MKKLIVITVFVIFSAINILVALCWFIPAIDRHPLIDAATMMLVILSIIGAPIMTSGMIGDWLIKPNRRGLMRIVIVWAVLLLSWIFWLATTDMLKIPVVTCPCSC